MKTLLLSLLCICISMLSLNLTAADLGNRNAILWEYEEWSLNNPSYSGNAYDLIAKVTFTHSPSGQQHTTQMFYTGSDTWAFRFTGTRTGTWDFVTTCDGSQGTSTDSSLHGHIGSVQVAPNPDPLARGFLTGEGNKFILAYGNSGKRIGYLRGTIGSMVLPDDLLD